MNEARFIELLNLYVDHQIDPGEAAELEAEVLRNPTRRRTYNQYCRMQKGCRLLGGHSRSNAPVAVGFIRSLDAAERKIARPVLPSWRSPYAGAFAACAMAACVAVVYVANRPETSSPETVAAVHTQPQAAPLAVKMAPPAVAVANHANAPVSPFDDSSALPVSGVVRNAREAEIAATDREALAWMQRVDQLPGGAMIVDEQAFEGRSTLQPNNRLFQSRHALEGKTELTGFQFQR